MKKILNKLFSRLFIFGVVILLQFFWIVYTLFVSSEQYYGVDIFIKVISVLIALYVVYKDIRPYNKLSWVFLILFLPIIGCPCFFLFGRSDMTKRSRNRMSEIENMISPLRIQSEEVKGEIKASSSVAFKQSNYILNKAYYPVYREDTSRYYKSGQDMFADMLNDLKNAREFIFLEFFIMEQGIMFDSIVDILEQKAKEVVQIRLIYDDLGCIKNFPPKYYKVLQKKGIHCACFNPFRPFLSIIMNNRDHRKILVIDGKIAYTGGVNLADEYINKVERFGYWKDAGVRLTGDCVWSFTTMFLEMWSFITRGKEDYTRFLVTENHNADQNMIHTKGFVQPYADCPLDKKYISEAVYLNLINHAEKYVYIFTPYLIIGTELATALINAASSGVDVRIVTPEIPDKKLVYLLTQANYEPLIRGGVKIYQYLPGFIHSKCFVVDDEYASVGSVNMDFRSLYLHFECGTLMYQTECVAQLKADAMNTFTECREISLADCENKNIVIQMLLSILHLFAPLL
jgi:cardiolipin synthase